MSEDMIDRVIYDETVDALRISILHARELADRIAALEAEASEGERRGLERALEFANFEAEAWGYADGSSARVAAANIARAIRELPEAPAQPELASAAANQISTAEIGLPEAPAREGWQPIETAPKDGTVVDLWHEDFGREVNFKWGHTEHSCGEAGRYCDSDWHSEEAGWVDTALNERYFAEDVFTHWRPLPSPPSQDREPDSQRGAK